MDFLIIKQTIHLIILDYHRLNHLRFFNRRQAHIRLSGNFKKHHYDASCLLLFAPDEQRHQLIGRIMKLNGLDVVIRIQCHQGFHR